MALRPRNLFVGLILLTAVWAGWELLAPHPHDLHDFQPVEVARLETEMWRSYYDRAHFQLFLQLATLLREQYGLPVLRSYLVAYHAAKAATVFQGGQGRSDYERALPHVTAFYAAIDREALTHFDVQHAARLELEWWIVHRERSHHSPADLERALAELQAELYHVPAERVARHANLRADAMLLRDSKAEHGQPSEQDWAEISRLLRESWQSLWDAVNLE